MDVVDSGKLWESLCRFEIMGAVNFMQIVAYQQCLDCKFVTYDHSFNDYVIKDGENTFTTTVSQKCPNCGSKNISGRYRDADLQCPEK